MKLGPAAGVVIAQEWESSEASEAVPRAAHLSDNLCTATEARRHKQDAQRLQAAVAPGLGRHQLSLWAMAHRSANALIAVQLKLRP
jgi:hypothetical protein